jgi:hypothetical protein
MMARLAVVLLAVPGEGKASFRSALQKMKGSAAVSTTAFLPGICTSEEQWTDDPPLTRECVMASVPLESECVAAGCWWVPKDDEYPEECSCGQETTCLALGASWEVMTCGEFGSLAPDEFKDATLKAVETGSCSDISVWDPDDYMEIAQVVAEACCKNFPASFCAPDAIQYGTPCATPEEFIDTQTYHAYCDLAAQPTEELCKAELDCMWYDWEDECDCWMQPGCEAVGGVWVKQECASLRNNFRNPQWHSAYINARETGDCDSIELWGDSFGNIVRDQANCCITRESFCGPRAW